MSEAPLGAPFLLAVLIRVITFNAWGLPVITPDREARMARIGPALAALEPDVVALQEVWVDRDAERIASDLARAGLPFHVRPTAGLVGSGLLVCSRFPLGASSFRAYGLAGKPYKPWHGDWYATKGLALVTVETPAGPIDLADTHLHAGYQDDAYLAERIVQALEASAVLGPEGDRPLILAGDLNSRRGSVPLRLLEERCGLVVTEGPRIDWVLARPGRALGCRVVGTEAALATEVDLGDGRRGRLSDHAALLARVELAAVSGVAPVATRSASLADEAARELQGAANEAVRGACKASLAGGALVPVAAWLVLGAWRARRAGRARRWGLRGLAVAAALGSGTVAWFALGFQPGRERELLRALGTLRSPVGGTPRLFSPGR